MKDNGSFGGWQAKTDAQLDLVSDPIQLALHMPLLLPLILAIGCGGGSVANSPPSTPVLTTIKVAPSSATIPVGNQQTFQAAAFDQNGSPILDATFTWASSNDAVSFSSPGVVVGENAGDATVTATSNGVSGQATVSVTPFEQVLTSLSISPTSATISFNSVITFEALALDQNGDLMAGSVNFTWSAPPDGTITVVTPTTIRDASPNGDSQVQFTAGQTQGSTLINVTADSNGKQVGGAGPSLTVVQ